MVSQATVPLSEATRTMSLTARSFMATVSELPSAAWRMTCVLAAKPHATAHRMHHAFSPGWDTLSCKPFFSSC